MGKHDMIDSISSLPKNLTFADLRHQHGTGRSFLVSDRGYEKKYFYRHGVQTEAGDILESLWIQAMNDLIDRSDERDLHNDLIEWVKEEVAWCHTKKEVELYALQLHSSRIFDNPKWCDYAAFNAKYRPSVLSFSTQVVQ